MNDQSRAEFEALMSLVSEFGQCRWSEASNGASYAKFQERQDREEAADLFKQIESRVSELSSIRSELLEALKLAREYVSDNLSERQNAYAGYPHKWSAEQEDLRSVDAVIAKYSKE